VALAARAHLRQPVTHRAGRYPLVAVTEGGSRLRDCSSGPDRMCAASYSKDLAAAGSSNDSGIGTRKDPRRLAAGGTKSAAGQTEWPCDGV